VKGGEMGDKVVGLISLIDPIRLIGSIRLIAPLDNKNTIALTA